MGDVDKGADVVVRRCLELEQGETLHLFSWGAADVAEAIARAVQRAGGKLRRMALEGADAAQIAASLSGATASMLVAGEGLSTPLRYAVVKAAARARTRHLHMPNVDARVLSQGARADPDVLAKINARVIDLVRPPSRIVVTSAAGTKLEISLSSNYALISANGRPARGTADNLPSGSVYTYPASVSGTFVADRGLFNSEVVTRGSLRRHPVKFVFADGRVGGFETGDDELAEQIETHFASHPRAATVGHITLPTNYLVRSEIGVQAQDNLLPGLNVSLGFSASKLTNAPTDAPVQLTLLARKVTVTANGKTIVTDGRFEQHVVAGLDPFR